jgi:hypothetical protein
LLEECNLDTFSEALDFFDAGNVITISSYQESYIVVVPEPARRSVLMPSRSLQWPLENEPPAEKGALLVDCAGPGGYSEENHKNRKEEFCLQGLPSFGVDGIVSATAPNGPNILI